jgi:hypothetical protein
MERKAKENVRAASKREAGKKFCHQKFPFSEILSLFPASGSRYWHKRSRKNGLVHDLGNSFQTINPNKKTK